MVASASISWIPTVFTFLAVSACIGSKDNHRIHTNAFETRTSYRNPIHSPPRLLTPSYRNGCHTSSAFGLLKENPCNHHGKNWRATRNDEAIEGVGNGGSEGDGKGFLVLATVPIAWGTFEPAVRLVYKYQPSMPPLVFSFAYYLVATLVLTTIGTLVSLSVSSDVPWDDANEIVSEREETQAHLGTSTDFDSSHTSGSQLPLSTRGGIELGTYLFIGNALQVIGLKTVSSDRAAFLLQLTTIFVPLLKSWTSRTVISLQTWIACVIALSGVALIGLDDQAGIGLDVAYGTVTPYAGLAKTFSHLLDRLPAFSADDGYIVLAAVFYTFHCVRLETYARSTSSAIGLATAKATTEMLWSGVSILGCILVAMALGVENVDGDGVTDLPGVVDMARASGQKIVWFGEGIERQISLSTPDLWFDSDTGWPSVLLATVWVGAVTVAYTIYAQSFGQSRVPAVTANLMYSSQPVFTAMVAYILLGESLGTNGYIGGILIGAAVLLVIAAEAKTEPRETMTQTND